MLVLTLVILVAMLIVMAAGWAFQRAAGNGGWTDVFWTYGTGACCAGAALVPADGAVGWRQMLVAALVAIWSLRLGSYIARRVARGPEDARYTIIRRSWGADFQRKMFGLLIVQAPVSALLGLAILYAARVPAPQFRVADALGVLILAGAIAGETVADGQMKRFKADIANHGQVCDRGLWGWSRHPNYLFEAVAWLAYPVMAIDLQHPWSLLSCIAPVLMIVVLRFGTGVPPLEAAMLQSRGEAYRRYQARVPALLPWPRSGG